MSDRSAITRREWDAHFWQHFRVLRKEGPTRDLDDVRAEAHEATERLHGPRPPGRKEALLKLAVAYLRRRTKAMKWDWTKTLWKAVRGAGGAALAVAVLSFLGAFDTEAEQLAAGVPKWMAPAGAMAVAFAVSWIRNWAAINHPEWNVVKKAGEKVRPALNGNAR